MDHDAHHWIRMTQKELRSTVFMDGISLVHVKRIVARGRQTGLIETFNPRNHQPLLYGWTIRRYDGASRPSPLTFPPGSNGGLQKKKLSNLF